MNKKYKIKCKAEGASPSYSTAIRVYCDIAVWDKTVLRNALSLQECKQSPPKGKKHKAYVIILEPTGA